MPNNNLFGEYLGAVLEYYHSHSSSPTTVADGDGCFSFTPDTQSTLEWVKLHLQIGKPPSVLEIKREYFVALEEVPMNEDSYAAAVASANGAHLHLKIEDLHNHSQSFLADAFEDRLTTARLLLNPQSFPLGIYNTPLIQSQNPTATILLPKSEYIEKGFSVSDLQAPIQLLFPSDTPYFNREGELVPLSEATPEEQFAVVRKDIPIHHEVQWEMKFLYDISQVSMTKMQRAHFMEEHFPKANLADLTQLAHSMGIKTEQQQITGLTIKALYNVAANTIVLTSFTENRQMLGDYALALSEAVAKQSFRESPTTAMEKSMLSAALCHKIGIPIGEELVYALAKNIPQGFFEMEKNLTTLCSSLSRVNKAAHFLSASLEKIMGQSMAAQEQSMTPSKAWGKSKQAPLEENPPLENFLRGI